MVKKKKKCDPFKNEDDKRDLMMNLSYEIVYSMTDKIVIMPTSMVASILLMNRKGISDDQLVTGVEWLS